MGGTNRGQAVITTSGTDGACAAALLLRHFGQDTGLYTTSKNVLPWLLKRLAAGDPRPAMLHICGVGLSEDPGEVLEGLVELRNAGVESAWYCGRGYLDAHKDMLEPLTRLYLQPTPSNTACVRQSLAIQEDDRVRLLLKLAAEYASRMKKVSKEDRFWHDYIQAMSVRYFKFGDRKALPSAIRKLASLMPLDGTEEGEARRIADRFHAPVLLGTSESMKKTREMVKRFAPNEQPVLILGQTGTGKELVARAIHDGSRRKDGPFLAVNCATLAGNPDMVNDRLFGHVAGAYTGARTDSAGAFEEADGGTLFLDELGEMPLDSQTRLLRVLEEHCITPLGTMKARRVDVRVVAATNRDLREMIGRGAFREDLYYRLNVLVIRLVPLREHLEDARPIAQVALAELAEEGYALKLDKDDWRAVEAYAWPGNIRQFINALRGAACSGIRLRERIAEEETGGAAVSVQIEPTALPPHIPLPTTIGAVRPEDEIRRVYIRHILDLYKGNLTKAAKALGLAKNTLRKWGGNDNQKAAN